MNAELTIADLLKRVHEFNASRGWEKYHTPKSLACAITCEAAELLELFQWLTDEQSSALDTTYIESAASEMADVLIFLLTLADILHVDLATSIVAKLERNEERYPKGQAFDPFAKADKQGSKSS